jgi:hypothetical protein
MTSLELTLSKIRENIHKRSPRAEAPLCEAQSFCKSRSAGEHSALRHNVLGAKEAECRNAERERNFAKCWGFWGKYFAKFASRIPNFLAGFWRDGQKQTKD